MPKLLDPDEFQAQVLARSQGRCVFCGAPATDARHIFDRKLFADGGYYLENGAAVCAEHHVQCEVTEISLPEIYRAAGITEPVFPPGFERDARAYDKWGNRYLKPSALEPLREGGPLKHDIGCQRALERANLLWTLK